ncbi:glycerophosphoryl diester phosphodiesterase membrane domain-containing protein [Streptomyces sp. NPDC003247]|uniref:glycerophosphoryl diester phosphodiesterase membrane domain-containing protein n=1 Tax=Streptomyces sp. NPDC003247 TaxID=3364677 RepID=UPI003698D4E6
MNDTPGWASPGSAPSDGQEPGVSHPADSADRPGGTQPTDQPAANPQNPGTKWSEEQPPPAPWSAPAGPRDPAQSPPPPPPAPGWGTRPPGAPGPTGPGGYGGHGGYGTPGGHGGHGGYGGWGAGWGGPPPAVKPGVIPLRPLGVGEILDGAVSTMRAHWRTVLGISLTVAVVIEVAVVLVQGLFLNDSASTAALSDPYATMDEKWRAMVDVARDSGVVFLIALVGSITATALLTTVTSRAVIGRPVTTGQAWRDARPQVPRLFGLVFFLMLTAVAIVVVGALPGALVGGAAGDGLSALGVIAALVVVAWLLTRFSLASPALMLEKQSIKKALARSAKLVRGSWWRVFGIQLLSMILANLIATIVVVPFALFGAALGEGGISAFTQGDTDLGWSYLVVSGIGSVIGSMITLPITAGVTALLYVDLRIRREALDLDLADAAGIQGYGTASPATPPRS